MTHPLREQMIKEFPFCYPSSFYFEVSDGWLPIIYAMSLKLNKAIENHNKSLPLEDKDFCESRVEQIKQKFGELRVYLSWTTPELEAIVDDAANQAAVACEICGAKGKAVVKNGWISIKCETHNG